jgi:hypothetical protein
LSAEAEKTKRELQIKEKEMQLQLSAEVEKTNRELKIKEKEMQLEYLDKFTQTAIDEDITKRIRLAHYISSTIDDAEYRHLSEKWLTYYNYLVSACQSRLKTSADYKTDSTQELSDKLECTIGGTFRILTATATANIPVALDTAVSGGGVLGDLIARVESGKYGYNFYNLGTPGESGLQEIDLSKLPISQIMEMQQRQLDDPKRIFAVARYTLLPATLISASEQLKIDKNSKFTPEIQEMIFRDYLISVKRPMIKRYITGVTQDDSGMFSAQLALAKEFASVARPDSGLSYYGVGLNKALTTPAETANALTVERASYQQNLAKGLSPDEAWEALSPGMAQKVVSDGPQKQ